MLSYEREDQPLDDPKEAYRHQQCFNLVLDQAIQSIEQSVDLNNLVRGHVKLFGFLSNFQKYTGGRNKETHSQIQAALTLITTKQY